MGVLQRLGRLHAQAGHRAEVGRALIECSVDSAAIGWVGAEPWYAGR